MLIRYNNSFNTAPLYFFTTLTKSFIKYPNLSFFWVILTVAIYCVVQTILTLCKTIETFLENDQLILLNTGEFTRHNSTNKSFSAIDLSINKSSFAPQFEWHVLNEYNCSDHWPISLTLLDQTPKTSSNTHTHWNLKKPNWELYQDLVNQNLL